MYPILIGGLNFSSNADTQVFCYVCTCTCIKIRITRTIIYLGKLRDTKCKFKKYIKKMICLPHSCTVKKNLTYGVRMYALLEWHHLNLSSFCHDVQNRTLKINTRNPTKNVQL